MAITASRYSILVLLMVLLSAGAYPIPVDCRSNAHVPTIADATISQPFGYLRHVGDDYKVSVGTEIYANMDGIIIQAVGDSRVYGRYVMLLHCDGYASLYGHLSKIEAKFGQVVNAGQLIGLSGGDPKDNIDGDGMSSGAHLHFEIRVPGHLDSNLYNMDPMKYSILVDKYSWTIPGDRE